MVSRPLRPRLVLVALLLIVVTVAPGAAQGASSFDQELPPQPAVDNTVTRIELAENGSARWSVTIRTRLDTAEDVEEYRAFQGRFRDNASRFLGPFESRMTVVASRAADATGRQMAVRDFTAETYIQEVPRRWGIVEFGFTWEGFAATDGGDLTVGDAFAGGFFLAANDTLVVVLPPGYTVTDVEPQATERDGGTLQWTGRVDFADGRPLIQATAAEAGEPELGGESSRESIPFVTLVGVGTALLAAIGGVAVLARRRRSGGRGSTAERAPASLTDEERVLDLLESRGGRVAQATIAETFDWSTSKTSRVLSRMAEEGAIEKLRLGRENLIELPDDEP